MKRGLFVPAKVTRSVSEGNTRTSWLTLFEDALSGGRGRDGSKLITRHGGTGKFTNGCHWLASVLADFNLYVEVSSRFGYLGIPVGAFDTDNQR